ncbi:MAG: NUDIX hydrolase [Gammaproteobacteria bacterium]|nr:NUDIX hydrolase [Gammaproteobacteria bacterium]
MAYGDLHSERRAFGAPAMEAYAGWLKHQAYIYNEMRRDPGKIIEIAAAGSENPSATYAAIAVQAVNRSGKLNMAGATFTDTITEGPTRRSFNANVYSRIAAGATVIAFREGGRGVEILLIKNKRKRGKLLPTEGYGKYGPLKHTAAHFSDVDSSGMDKAEELILKGMPVNEAYGEVAETSGAGKHPYGSYDLTLEDTAKREFREELGIPVPGELKQIYEEMKYNSAWGLHTLAAGFLLQLGSEELVFSPDEAEVESIHFIALADVTVEADGSGRVKGFAEVIPESYISNIKKVRLAYEAIQIEKISNGLINSLEQLKVYVALTRQACPEFIPFGPDSVLSTHNIRTFTAELIRKLQAPLPFLTLGAAEAKPSEVIASP